MLSRSKRSSDEFVFLWLLSYLFDLFWGVADRYALVIFPPSGAVSCFGSSKWCESQAMSHVKITIFGCLEGARPRHLEAAKKGPWSTSRHEMGFQLWGFSEQPQFQLRRLLSHLNFFGSSLTHASISRCRHLWHPQKYTGHLKMDKYND